MARGGTTDQTNDRDYHLTQLRAMAAGGKRFIPGTDENIAGKILAEIERIGGIETPPTRARDTADIETYTGKLETLTQALGRMKLSAATREGVYLVRACIEAMPAPAQNSTVIQAIQGNLDNIVEGKQQGRGGRG